LNYYTNAASSKAGFKQPIADYIAAGNYIPLTDASEALGYGDSQYLTAAGISTDQLGNPRRFTAGKCDAGAFEINKQTRWTGNNESSDWSNPANWDNAIPSYLYDVIIPGNCAVYPTLSAGDAATCNEIYFETGGEIGQIQHLTYNKAFVDLNLGYYTGSGATVNAKPSSKYLQRDRFYTITAPLKEIVVGDFAFGGKPNAYAQYADPIRGNEIVIQGFTNPLPYYNVPLSKGFGFAYSVNHSEEEEGSGNISATNPAAIYDQTNLNSVQGVVTFPYFAKDDVRTTLNPYHAFDGTSSTFSYYRLDGQPSAIPADVITRNPALANRFIAEDESNTIPSSFTLPLNDELNSETLVGNPFLSHLDFTNLYLENKDVISPYYRIWNGNSSFIVEVDDATGTVVSTTNPEAIDEADANLIAPLQSFFVERKADGDFNVNVADVSATKDNGASEPALRASRNENESLKIVARSEKGASALVLHRASNVSESGIRKVFTSYKEVPELYFNMERATEILTVDKSVASVPVGIKALDGESIVLSFSGIENLSDEIHLLDTKDNTTISLNASIDSYSFTNDANLKNRFHILFDRTITGLQSSFVNDLSISAKDDWIQVITSPVNLIQSVKIYNPQGQLISANTNLSSPAFSVDLNAKGLLMIEVTTANSRVVKKSIKY
jgi:hypothetical protein